MKCNSYMKASFFFALTLFLPALAVSAPAFADVETPASISCPNCGETITLGRHGQEGQAFKCPSCGKEVFPKPGEEETGFCIGSDAGFLSKYVSRGVNTTDGFVFQPDVWASYKGFTASVWASMDLVDKNGLRGDFSEFDFTLDYSGNITEKLGYSAGAVYYTFPHTGADDTAEAYLGLSYDMPLNPKLIVFYDFWQVDGFYASLSVGHSFGLPEVVKGVNASLELSAQVGLGSRNFNEFNFGASHTAFIDMVYTAALPVSVSEHITVKPLVSYSSALDRTIRFKNPKNDNVIWGVVASVSF